jgi:hypothetical protein
MAMRPDEYIDFQTIPLEVTLASERMNDGLEEQVAMHMAEYPETVMIVMDVYADIEATNIDTRNMNAYQRDRALMKPFRDMRDKYPKVAFVIIHHNRKSDSTNEVHRISGSQGIASSVDNIAIITSVKNNDTMVKVDIRSRDLGDNQPSKFYMKHGEKGRLEWIYAGEEPPQEKKEETPKQREESKQAKYNAWTNQYMNKWKWRTWEDFKKDASTDGFVDDIELGRSRTANSIKSDKSRKIYYINEQYKPTADDIERYKQSKMIQAQLGDFVTEVSSINDDEPLPFDE